MATYVFLLAPARGHVNPALAVISTLVQSGHRVLCYLPEEFRPVVESNGATLRTYQVPAFPVPAAGQGVPEAGNGGGSRRPSAFLLQQVSFSEQLLPQIIEQVRADAPDVIIYDPMVLWGRIVCRVLSVPAITFRSTYAYHERMPLEQLPFARLLFSDEGGEERLQTALTRLYSRYDVPPIAARDLFLAAEDCNIVTIPRSFQPEGQTFDERFVFVGPCLAPRHDSDTFPWEQLTSDPILYISLGTIFTNWPAFFQMCLEAFGSTPWQVILSYGKQVDPQQWGHIPANVILRPYTPQLEILARSTAFISHGGMNSVMESLYFGVPMVMVPQMGEQEITAQRVASLGAGIALEKTQVTVERLQDAVEHLVQQTTYRQQAQVLQDTIHASGGYRLAAETIIRFQQTHQ